MRGVRSGVAPVKYTIRFYNTTGVVPALQRNNPGQLFWVILITTEDGLGWTFQIMWFQPSAIEQGHFPLIRRLFIGVKTPPPTRFAILS